MQDVFFSGSKTPGARDTGSPTPPSINTLVFPPCIMSTVYQVYTYYYGVFFSFSCLVSLVLCFSIPAFMGLPGQFSGRTVVTVIDIDCVPGTSFCPVICKQRSQLLLAAGRVLF